MRKSYNTKSKMIEEGKYDFFCLTNGLETWFQNQGNADFS